MGKFTMKKLWTVVLFGVVMGVTPLGRADDAGNWSEVLLTVDQIAGVAERGASIEARLKSTIDCAQGQTCADGLVAADARAVLSLICGEFAGSRKTVRKTCSDLKAISYIVGPRTEAPFAFPLETLRDMASRVAEKKSEDCEGDGCEDVTPRDPEAAKAAAKAAEALYAKRLQVATDEMGPFINVAINTLLNDKTYESMTFSSSFMKQAQSEGRWSRYFYRKNIFAIYGQLYRAMDDEAIGEVLIKGYINGVFDLIRNADAAVALAGIGYMGPDRVGPGLAAALFGTLTDPTHAQLEGIDFLLYNLRSLGRGFPHAAVWALKKAAILPDLFDMAIVASSQADAKRQQFGRKVVQHIIRTSLEVSRRLVLAQQGIAGSGSVLTSSGFTYQALEAMQHDFVALANAGGSGDAPYVVGNGDFFGWSSGDLTAGKNRVRDAIRDELFDRHADASRLALFSSGNNLGSLGDIMGNYLNTKIPGALWMGVQTSDYRPFTTAGLTELAGSVVFNAHQLFKGSAESIFDSFKGLFQTALPSFTLDFVKDHLMEDPDHKGFDTFRGTKAMSWDGQRRATPEAVALVKAENRSSAVPATAITGTGKPAGILDVRTVGDAVKATVRIPYFLQGKVQYDSQVSATDYENWKTKALLTQSVTVGGQDLYKEGFMGTLLSETKAKMTAMLDSVKQYNPRALFRVAARQIVGGGSSYALFVGGSGVSGLAGLISLIGDAEGVEDMLSQGSNQPENQSKLRLTIAQLTELIPTVLAKSVEKVKDKTFFTTEADAAVQAIKDRRKAFIDSISDPVKRTAAERTMKPLDEEKTKTDVIASMKKELLADTCATLKAILSAVRSLQLDGDSAVAVDANVGAQLYKDNNSDFLVAMRNVAQGSDSGSVHGVETTSPDGPPGGSVAGPFGVSPVVGGESDDSQSLLDEVCPEFVFGMATDRKDVSTGKSLIRDIKNELAAQIGDEYKHTL